MTWGNKILKFSTAWRKLKYRRGKVKRGGGPKISLHTSLNSANTLLAKWFLEKIPRQALSLCKTKTITLLLAHPETECLGTPCRWADLPLTFLLLSAPQPLETAFWVASHCAPYSELSLYIQRLAHTADYSCIKLSWCFNFFQLLKWTAKFKQQLTRVTLKIGRKIPSCH